MLKSRLLILFLLCGLHSDAQYSFDYSELPQSIQLDNSLLKELNMLMQVIETENSDVMSSFVNGTLSQAVFEEIGAYERAGIDSTKKLRRKLMNYYPLKKNMSAVKFASYAVGKESEIIVQWTVLIKKYSNGHTFSTPLFYNTDHWQETKFGNVRYRHREALKAGRAELFAKKNALFAEKFKKEEMPFMFYMVDSYQEIMQLLGIDYARDAVGKIRDGWGVVSDYYIFSVMNNEDFSHDLFHFYSGKVHKDETRNWVTEEGMAYYWGNAYYTKKDGEMAEQYELAAILKEYLNKNPRTDLYELFTKHMWSDKTGIYSSLAPDFKVGRLISGIICEEVERLHGMDGVNQLLSCGSKPNRFKPFLEVTDRLININEKNFNRKLKKLLKKY